MIPLDRMKVNINPSVACDGREQTGKNEKALCEVTQAMNAHSQLAPAQKFVCATSSRTPANMQAKSVDGSKY